MGRSVDGGFWEGWERVGGLGMSWLFWNGEAGGDDDVGDD